MVASELVSRLVLVGIWVLWRAGKDPENPHGYASRDLEEPAATLAVRATK